MNSNTNKTKYILIPILCIIILVVLLTTIFNSSQAFSHGDEVHTFVDSSEEQKQKLQECLAQSDFQDSCYFELCANRNPYICAQEILDAVVLLSGPEKGIEVLYTIMASPLFGIRTDGHQLSHVVGRSTSHHYGLNGVAFLRCPVDFNYGCMHGFFEDALLKHTTPVQAAIEICETVPPRPNVNKFYCYHGVGHGFMFNESYNLISALALCDMLPSITAQKGCWQGLFMENLNSFFDDTIEGERGDMDFMPDDVLAPCNRIENRYRDQCYENHGKYILHHYGNSIREASYACLGAGDHIYFCLISLGSFTTGRGWQEALKGSFNGTFGETAAYLCNQFPPEYIETCQSSGIANLLNFDQGDIRRAADFCLSFDAGIGKCFRYIGARLFHIVSTTDEAIQSCATAPVEFQDDCHQGTNNELYYGRQQQNSELENPMLQQQTNIDEQHKIETSSFIIGDNDSGASMNEQNNEGISSSILLYFFIVLGCILFIAPLTYYFKCSK